MLLYNVVGPTDESRSRLVRTEKTRLTTKDDSHSNSCSSSSENEAL